MDRSPDRLWNEHFELTRRYFLKVGAGLSLTALAANPTFAAERHAALERAIAQLEFFTDPAQFGTVERGKPLPYSHPVEKLREVGMTRDTWKLEIVADEESKSAVGNPMTKEAGNALDFDGLMKLAEKHAVRFPKIMTCNNGGSPLGMGLWEGVPLREAVWLAKPGDNIRRLYYHGYHNDDPAQMFRSSLPIGRVLEDPPDHPPVILCFKLNGEFLSGKRGAPVRIVVPENYGFKSVKWIQKITLTNAPFANDTYAGQQNDIDSWMKTFARILSFPAKSKPGEPIPVTGLAQVGISGLKKVQYWLKPESNPLPPSDPHFASAPWKDAEILPAPSTWKPLPDAKVPAGTFGFDETGKPNTWPMRYALVHWAVLLNEVPAGKYELRCRTIDANGNAQPMPRPFPKSGRNNIQSVTLEVS